MLVHQGLREYIEHTTEARVSQRTQVILYTLHLEYDLRLYFFVSDHFHTQSHIKRTPTRSAKFNKKVGRDSHERAQVPEPVNEVVEIGDVIGDVHLVWVNLLQLRFVHLRHA